MKRFPVILLVLLLSAAMLIGCRQAGANNKIIICCTIFPQYDWVRQILGDKADDVDLVLLLDDRIDLHNYQPSARDMAAISTCDLFIYVGGESDGWVSDALREAANQNRLVVNLLDRLGDAAKREEIAEGMEEDIQHDGDDAEAEADPGHEAGFDEHIWLSLRNARTCCIAIAGALTSLDPENGETYQSNLAEYVRQLSALDSAYLAAADAASVKTLLFADRFPFRYLAEDYGLSYYAAFPGCSAETEASFATVVFLSQKVDELQLPCVMVTESADQSIARTVIQNTRARSQRICVLDAMQSVSSGDVQNGATYLSIMESNLDVLKEALY
jgi:zinc transport system substrate-binding protein